jgi:hypothetical protein
MSALKCKKCLSVCFIKSGHTRGMQRDKCKDCHCQFTSCVLAVVVDPVLKAVAF